MTVVTRAAVLTVRGYQWIVSPLLPPACRFAPTCSEYAVQVIMGHGVMRGMVLALRRLGRCHPFNSGGYDPPPIPRRKD